MYLYVRFNFSMKFLQVLNDGAVDGSTQICMLVGDGTRFVANAIVYILVRYVRKIEVP